MSSLQIGRLLVGPPFQWQEQFGDPVTSIGGAIIPQPRAALRHAVDIGTLAADGATDTLAARLVIRRQLRSLLNNTPLKLQGGYYVLYSDDSENSGWYVPDQGQIADGEGSMGLATGWWKLANLVWFMAGHRRSAREGRSIFMKDLRTGLWARDYLGWVLSTDFSALPTLQLSVMPNGATQIANTSSNQVSPSTALPTGRDGGVAQQLSGLPDLTIVAYERPESALNLSDVIAYDRRGLGASPAPEVGNTNFCPNPSFEYDTAGNAPAGWVTNGPWFWNTGATLTAVNSQQQVGSQAMRVVTTNALAAEGAGISLSGTFQSGVTYNFSIWLKGNAGGESVNVDLGDTGGSSDTSQHIVTLTTAWQRFNFNWTPSANRSAVWCGVSTQAASAYTFFADGAVVVQASVVPTYFDGDTSGYLWSGTKGNAVSVINPQTYGWEELYGPDYPYNWTTGGQPNDIPVLDNGLVRIRYNATALPGFSVDVWTGSAYVEQGKMIVRRVGDSTGFCDTWVSASVMEYSPDRTVISCVLRNSGDSYSRERVFITLQRGELGAMFECYPALKSNGTQADARLEWNVALNAGTGDLNNSLSGVNSQGSGSWTPGGAGTGLIVATAGTGAGTGNSGLFANSLTNFLTNFASAENWVTVLRCPTAYNAIGPYQTTLVVNAGTKVNPQYAGSQNFAYGGNATNTYHIVSLTGAGYVQAQVYFATTSADQIMEAESMGTTHGGTTVAADGGASGTGNNSTSTTRTADAIHVNQPSWPNGFLATYRVFVRVRTTASTLNVYAKTGATTGSTVTTTSASYVWLDLGEITANNTNLEIHMWATAAATCWLDRVEAVMVQDRARTNFVYSGARDFAQAALTDSRALGCLVAR